MNRGADVCSPIWTVRLYAIPFEPADQEGSLLSAVSAATLAAALLFISFHIEVWPITTGKMARVIGVGYHLLMLPSVAALPAPQWARAAGFGWMLMDAALNGAAYAGLDTATGDAFRQGVHILSAVWVIAAGWTGGGWLAAAGTLLGVVFLVRTALAGTNVTPRTWVRYLNAVLNVSWMVSVAVTLWRA